MSSIATGKKMYTTHFKKEAIILGILPGLVLFLSFSVIPSILTFFFSFTDIRQIPGRPWQFVGLDNYREVLFQSNSRDMLDSLKRTFIFSLAVTGFQTAFALLLSILLTRKNLAGKNIYRTIIFLPNVLGVTVTGLCFKLLFSIDGPARILLGLFGKSSAFFGDWNLALPLVIFCQVWMYVGYEMVIFIAGLQNISEDLYEAARIDGASEWQIFYRVTIPLLWSTVMVNVTLCIVGSLSAFQIILVTTQGSPPTRTLAMFVYQTAFGVGGGNNNTGRQGLAAAMQMLLFVFILVITIFSRYLMSRKEEE
ncbi:MAG: sugar ABC transporter permease [Treponema sp.]|nr:sugar ABC transporter permease [Treponema sp.]